MGGPTPELSSLDFHVLLALADGPQYGYAIKEEIEAASRGNLTPRAGSLYRVLGRMMAAGLVREAEPAGETPAHPGLARRYYALTRSGRTALAAEARHLKHAAEMAERRLGIAPGRS